eukprot:gene9869-29331_t
MTITTMHQHRPDMNELSPEDRAKMEKQQDTRRKVSEYIGEYLLKGYTMLGTACDQCGTVLMRDRDGVEHCLAKNVPGACEDAPAPAPAPACTPAAPIHAPQPTGGGGTTVRDVDISAYLAAAEGTASFSAEPPARAISPQHCNTVLLRDRSGKEICVAQEVPGACPGEAQAAPASAAQAPAPAAGGGGFDGGSETDSDEEAVWARRRKELVGNAQLSAAQELQRRMEMVAVAEAKRQMQAAAAPVVPVDGGPRAGGSVFGAAPGPASPVGASVMNAARVLSAELDAATSILAAGTSFQAKMEAAQLIATLGAALQSLDVL